MPAVHRADRQAMAEYVVVDVSGDPCRVVLRDSKGRFNTARAPEALPVEGQHLHGQRAFLGLSLMSDPATGQVYRLIFESIDCTAASTFGWIPR